MRTTSCAAFVFLAALESKRVAAGRFGDYIAAGLGLQSPSSITNVSSIVSSTASIFSFGSNWNRTSTTTTSSTSSSVTNSLVILGPTTSSSSSRVTLNDTWPTNAPSIANLTHISFNDSCWQQWEDFYHIWTQSQTVYTATVPTTMFGPSVSDGTTLYNVGHITETYTAIQYDGAHPIATSIFPTTYDFPFLVSSLLGVETITETVTTKVWTASWDQFKTPNCVLPTQVAGCQSSWDVYESEFWKHEATLVWPECAPRLIGTGSVHRNPDCWNAWTSFYHAAQAMSSTVPGRPLCTQASIAADYCSSEASKLLTWGTHLVEDAKSGAGWTASSMPNGSSSLYWATDRRLAPGCTLGCQQCKLTGSSVRMFFWPPRTGAVDPNGPPMTAVGLGTTFTSPTVYVSFDTLFASDSCSAIGGTYSNTILAIPQSTSISSLWGMNFINGFQFTASFNFSDLLHTPVPNSIFNRQPRCALAWFNGNYQYDLDSYNCSRDYPYNPILMIPDEVRDMDPAWANCNGGIRGVYDPPIALQPAEIVAVATMPVAENTYGVPAAPAATPSAAASQTYVYAPEPTTSKFPHVVFDPFEGPQSEVQASISAATRTSQNPSTLASEPVLSASVAIIQISSQEVTAIVADSSGAVQIGSSTLQVSDAFTLQDQIISVASSGLVLNDQVATFTPAGTPSQASALKSALLTIGNEVLTAVEANEAFLFGTNTLSVGATTVISGHTFEAGPTGLTYDGVAVNVTTPQHHNKAHHSATAIIPLQSATMTALALPSNKVLIDGTTLTTGESVTVDGHTLLAQESAVIVDGHSTVIFGQSSKTYKPLHKGTTATTSSTGASSSTEIVQSMTASPSALHHASSGIKTDVRTRKAAILLAVIMVMALR